MNVSLQLSHLDAFLATEVSTKALQRDAYLQSRRGINDLPCAHLDAFLATEVCTQALNSDVDLQIIR